MRIYVLSIFITISTVFKPSSGATPVQEPMTSPNSLSAPDEWLVIGPFPIGTREAPWGADPLERHGGFPNISHDANQRFRSSIAPGGEVQWSTQKAKSVNSSDRGLKISLEFGFPNIDWSQLQSASGWAALQWQAWARGSVYVDENQTLTRLLIYTEHILEFAIDGERVFGGDLYGLRRAPLVLYLEPGYRTFDLRLVRDVRAMGAVGSPTVGATLELQTVIEEVMVVEGSGIVSSVVDGRLASQYASITVCNKGRDPIEVLGFNSTSHSDKASMNAGSVRIAPGQTRPISFLLSLANSSALEIGLALVYMIGDSPEAMSELPFSLKLQHLPKHHVHKVTYLHPGGIVSYALLRPPLPKAQCRPGQKSAPVLLHLHGAGVEADNYIVAHAFDPIPDLCAWVLFPSGVTPWSADDWHTWGFADVRAAINSIPEWIGTNQWDGIGVDTEKWLVSGHSNGGQGTTYIMTHWPEKVIGAAPVSGYLSIPQYVPYSFWRSMEPKRRAIVDAALNSWRLDLLLENAKDIPIQIQHGSNDDNVPVYHSRLMYQSLGELDGSLTKYSEIEGAGHWFDGVMTTDGLKDFYQSILHKSMVDTTEEHEFCLVVASPADFGSSRGFSILQLNDPSQLGKLCVTTTHHTDSMTARMIITTINVRQFSVDVRRAQLAQKIFVDEEAFDLAEYDKPDPIVFWREKDRIKRKHWDSSLKRDARVYPRTGRQLGGIDAILRTHGRFIINYLAPEAFSVAVQISRNLHTYFYADAEIFSTVARNLPAHTGNRITLAIGDTIPECHHPNPFSIRLASTDPARLSIRDEKGRWHDITATQGSLSAIWGEPLDDERLQLIVWGEDLEGLKQAARLIPTITGVGVPDFVFADGTAKWKGVDGVLAIGFFDSWWNVTASSYLGD